MQIMGLAGTTVPNSFANLWFRRVGQARLCGHRPTIGWLGGSALEDSLDPLYFSSGSSALRNRSSTADGNLSHLGKARARRTVWRYVSIRIVQSLQPDMWNSTVWRCSTTS